MHGDGHAVSGAIVGLGFAAVAQLDHGTGLIAASLTAFGASGIGSPDIDLWLKAGGKLAHRRGTHYWRWQAYLAGAGGVVVALAAPELWWAWGAYVIGWPTHLAGDWVFGQKDRYRDGPGIPLAGPDHGYHGLGLDSGGWFERVFTWAVLVPLLGVTVKYWSGMSWGATAFLALGIAAAGELTTPGRGRSRLPRTRTRKVRRKAPARSRTR